MLFKHKTVPDQSPTFQYPEKIRVDAWEKNRNQFCFVSVFKCSSDSAVCCGFFGLLVHWMLSVLLDKMLPEF